jgi:2-polyprenyl-3-methyl-5-hydroxy-6-metoxy-1,4-benzoquinol methylase
LVLSQTNNESYISEVDDKGLYGKSYWFEHQEKDLGFGNILSRTRTDIPERVLHWLRTILKYKIPPGQTLELGCSHGGFVYALQMAGFQATGLELSPWVVNFAQQTFHIPVLQGELETQNINRASLDAVILMDVLEHLPDPLKTISHCLDLLKPDGILLIQTPCYPEGKGYEEMLQENHPFLQMLQAPEHIFLFSQSSITRFFQQLGIVSIAFEAAYFAHTDMFLAAYKSEPVLIPPETLEQSLMKTPDGRLVLALLDLEKKRKEQEDHLHEIEVDRAERMKVIQELGHRLGEIEGERNDLKNQLQGVMDSIEIMEGDRAARLTVIEQQGTQLAELNAEHAATLVLIEQQGKELSELNAEHAARLALIEQQGEELAELHADHTTKLAVIDQQGKELSELKTDCAEKIVLIEQQAGEIASLKAERAAKLALIEKETFELRALQAELDQQRCKIINLDALRNAIDRFFRNFRH